MPLLVQTAVICGILMIGLKTAGRGFTARFAPVDMVMMLLIAEIAAVQIALMN